MNIYYIFIKRSIVLKILSAHQAKALHNWNSIIYLSPLYLDCIIEVPEDTHVVCNFLAWKLKTKKTRRHCWHSWHRLLINWPCTCAVFSACAQMYLPKCLSKLTNIVIGFCFERLPLWVLRMKRSLTFSKCFLENVVLAANKLNCFIWDQRFRCHMVSK